MSSTTVLNADHAYNLPNVPFVQYFNKGYALHGTYWHDMFGTGVRMAGFATAMNQVQTVSSTIEAIARKTKWYLDLDIDPETEITVTCGSTEGMIAAMMATVDPGGHGGGMEGMY